jgi:staphylococcal nuclease domain-containing protein 1
MNQVPFRLVNGFAIWSLEKVFHLKLGMLSYIYCSYNIFLHRTKSLLTITVSFTRKQGATAGDRVYGILFITDETGTRTNLALQCVRDGFAIPKIYPNGNGSTDGVENKESPEDASKIYERELAEALDQAIKAKVGIHADLPLVRSIKNAGEEFQIFDLIDKVKKFTAKGTVKCIIEYIFDGSRFRCQVVDPELQELQYANFTLLLGGVAAPRIGNPKLDPPTESEPFAEEARQFVELRLLQRELEITLHGTDKPGVSIVGTIHHPRGNIAVELLKAGLAKISDWSVRMLNTADVPALRIAENAAKRTNLKVWAEYSPPQLAGSSEIVGTVVEVLTGDTVSILPSGVAYDSEDKLKKISLARADEPYSFECKERLRVLCVGKLAKVKINYERDIPLGPGVRFPS